MPNNYCLPCHKIPEKYAFGKLRFPHNKHLEIHCANCHNRVSHPNIEGYTDRQNMESCFDCHKQKDATIKCYACHPTGVVKKPNSHKIGEWRTAHKLSATMDCLSCHKAEYCDKCHENPKTGTPVSHKSPSWLGDHKASTNKACAISCHEPSYCLKCHTGPNGEPSSHKQPGWVSERMGRFANDNCTALCHQKTFCSKCHENEED